jgi:hypothetical protein
VRKLLMGLALATCVAQAQTNLSLPAGTALSVRLQKTLSTATSKTGDAISGSVIKPVTYNGTVVIPAGSTVEGHVTSVRERRRIAGKATIGILPETLVLPNGDRLPLHAVLVDTSLRDGSDVNDEGQFKGPGHDGADLRELVVGGGGGLGIGIVTGGIRGGFIGAGIGAAASGVHYLVKKRSATLPAGTELTMELDRPLNAASTAHTARSGGGE